MTFWHVRHVEQDSLHYNFPLANDSQRSDNSKEMSLKLRSLSLYGHFLVHICVEIFNISYALELAIKFISAVSCHARDHPQFWTTHGAASSLFFIISFRVKQSINTWTRTAVPFWGFPTWIHTTTQPSSFPRGLRLIYTIHKNFCNFCDLIALDVDVLHPTTLGLII